MRARAVVALVLLLTAAPAAADMTPAPPRTHALRGRGISPRRGGHLGEGVERGGRIPRRAYVKMGRLDDARGVLDRLRPLDAARARELDEVIAKGK